jgi:peptide/nickel transport system permease protein
MAGSIRACGVVQARIDPVSDSARQSFSHPRRLLRTLASMPGLVLAAAALLVSVLLMALLADVIAPRHYTTQDLTQRLQPPAFLGGPSAFWLGSDELGRDVLSRLLYALRFSLLIAVAGTIIGCVLGTKS